MSNTLHIGVAGLGTVGSAVVQILQQQADLLAARVGRPLRVTAVSARNKGTDRDFSMADVNWYDDALSLAAAPEVDMVVELIGGSEGIAKSLCETALANGKHVVTANKALIAQHGVALAQSAEHHNSALLFEAAVAGGIPILKAMREGFAGNNIRHVIGILNGTCNFILDQMKLTGRDFSDVLAEAQALGYAEADPTFDVDGIDTAHKLAILTSLAFGTAVSFDDVHIEGIRQISAMDIQQADELGYNIKLLGISRLTEHGIEQRVHPCMIKQDQPMALIPDAYNAVELEGDAVGKSLLQGRGAGGGPTASAVIADIIDIARGYKVPAFGIPAVKLKPLSPAVMNHHEGAYYIRLSVLDVPGVLAAVSSILFEEGVSLESCIQHGRAPGETVPLAMITHLTQEQRMKKALARIEKLENITEVPHMIRIETL